MKDYTDFILSKLVEARPVGFDVQAADIHPMLFGFQKAAVQLAVRRGRSALFEETGMGKTLQFIEWARIVAQHTGGKVLILCPLAVAPQTVREGRKIDVAIRYCRSQAEADAATESIIITNYDMAKEFDGSRFAGVVLDESGILKAFTGKTKRLLVEMFQNTPFRLACSATPAPNDYLEYGNHSEFLGIMLGTKMISRWFINDTMQAGNYRLKNHARKDFWRWMTSWAVCATKPSDISEAFAEEDPLYELPPLNFYQHAVEVDHSRAWEKGQLFLTEALSATGMWREKRLTAEDRCQRALEIVGSSDDYWIIWCDTNTEADILKRLFPRAVEVRGSDSVTEKERKLTLFSDGGVQQIITKPDIAAWGVNWQHCANQVFVGVSYSFEKLYQALRRSWRFRQTRPVNAYVIHAETEGDILEAIRRKQQQHAEMQVEMTAAQRERGLAEINRSQLAGAINTSHRTPMAVPDYLVSKEYLYD
jgi:hypothetical protein